MVTVYCRATAKGSHIRWRKVLYERQNVPDNYVDASFLTEMKKNLYLRSYSYQSLVLNSGRITQQISSVLIFIMCYVFLNGGYLKPAQLNTLSATLIMACHVVSRNNNYRIDFKAVALFTLASLALSPVLMSLTDTISTDTIYAMTCCMFIIHLFSHDYSDESMQIPGVVSLNTAIFATACLASRLKSISNAFSLIFLSILLFAVLPNTRRYMRTQLLCYADCSLTVTLFITAAVMIYTQTVALSILHLLQFIFITFICPYLLLNLQPLKNNIHGPWDEAVAYPLLSHET